MSADWIIKDVRILNVEQPSGEAPKNEPASYHFPRLKRTIRGGPGNRSSIIDCSCGACFDGVYEYLGHDRRMCDWYAKHAGIAGGGEAVAGILRQYDTVLDAVRYPDHPRTHSKSALDPEAILDRLRVGR